MLMANTNTKTNKQTMQHHPARTLFASLVGILAVLLIMLSVTVVWLNRTLTDTNTFVSLVGPLASKPAVQNFVAEKVTDQILKNTNPNDLAKQILPQGIMPNADPNQLNSQLTGVINPTVQHVMQSQAFQSLWVSTIRSAHASVVAQLDNDNARTISIDVSPAIIGVLSELKTTQIAPIVGKVGLKPGDGVINVKNVNVSQLHHYYKLFKAATWVILLLALVLIGLSVWISVHHGKTLRGILFVIGILSLTQGLLFIAPEFLKINGSDPAQSAAEQAIATALLHNLQIACFILAGVSLGGAIGSKLYEKYRK
jgi:hypothetical protein